MGHLEKSTKNGEKWTETPTNEQNYEFSFIFQIGQAIFANVWRRFLSTIKAHGSGAFNTFQ